MIRTLIFCGISLTALGIFSLVEPRLVLVGSLCAAVFGLILLRVLRRTRDDLRAASDEALRDALTGLPTRRLFDDRLAQALSESSRNGSEVALMLIDLDKFKEVNDAFGHPAGDALLREVACRLVGAVREADTVARIGGDEFAVILAGADEAAARETAHRIREGLTAPLELETGTVPVAGSIGIALHPRDGDTAAALAEHADAAMYVAKRAGIDFAFFDGATRASTEEWRAFAMSMRAAVGTDQLLLHYQPRLDLTTGRLSSVEALLRWSHPSRGLLPATAFMAGAARIALAQQIFDHALAAAFAQAGAWQRDGFDVDVSINLDPNGFARLPARIEQLLKEHRVDAERIEIDISEAAIVSNFDRVREVAAELAALGLILVVDDFGSHHAALAALGALPVEKLKLGAPFIHSALTSIREQAIAHATVRLAHRLGLGVVAEGVEDVESFAFVQSLGVDHAQGYYIGRPVDAEAIREKLQREERVVA